MSPLSQDPIKRARQLANLNPAARKPPENNVRTLKHGGTARKATLIVAQSWAARIFDELEAEAPLRASDGSLPPHDRQAVELLASCLARLQAVTSWLDTRPACDEKGKPWPAEDTARRLRAEAARLLDALGMSPASRARIGLDLVRARDVLSEVMAEMDDDEEDADGTPTA
jgi:hypothetical protein